MTGEKIEEMVRDLVHGFKESQRLERQANRAQTAEQNKQVKAALTENEERAVEIGIQLAATVLTDLHRIADALETMAKPRSMI